MEKAQHYILYHIQDLKVGCTKDYTRRIIDNIRDYREMGIIIKEEDFCILDILPADGISEKEAGDLEYRYADMYGYDRGTHYSSQSQEACEKHSESISNFYNSPEGKISCKQRGNKIKAFNRTPLGKQVRKEAIRKGNKLNKILAKIRNSGMRKCGGRNEV